MSNFKTMCAVAAAIVITMTMGLAGCLAAPQIPAPTPEPAEAVDSKWTLQPRVTNVRLRGVHYGNGTWMAVGGSGAASGTIVTSADGATWKLEPHDSNIERGAYDIGNGREIAYAHAHGHFTDHDLFDVHYADNAWIIGGSGATLVTSADGAAWRRVAQAGIGIGGSILTDVHYANGAWVAAGHFGAIVTIESDAARTAWEWRRRSWAGLTGEVVSPGVSLPPITLYGARYGKDKWVAVGDRGIILTSEDNGLTWKGQDSGTDAHLVGVDYTEGTWVAVGDRGTIITSSDGITWTEQVKDTNVLLLDVHFANGAWMAVGDSGKIITSADGVTWTSQASSSITQRLNAIHYANGTWVAVGHNGTIITQPMAPIYDYVCTNGTATSGKTGMKNQEKCASCNSGYNLESEACVSTSDLNANQILLLGTWGHETAGTLVFTVGAVTHGAVTCTTWGVTSSGGSDPTLSLTTNDCSGGTSSVIANDSTKTIEFSMNNTVVSIATVEFTKQ